MVVDKLLGPCNEIHSQLLHLSKLFLKMFFKLCNPQKMNLTIDSPDRIRVWLLSEFVLIFFQKLNEVNSNFLIIMNLRSFEMSYFIKPVLCCKT